MSEKRNWTPSQLNAIEAKGSDLLVSASAGSGKTAVLIERIIRHITDTENKCDISEMLIVTFTEAAAKQLKSKLSIALKEAINNASSGKKHLRRQLALLPMASISTIDGFCLNIVKNNFAALDLSANVRIADAAENTLVMKEVMEQCLEDFYDKGEELGVPDFPKFCNAYTQLTDDNIGDIFLGMYETLYTRINGIEILLENARELESTVDSDPFLNKWGAEIKNRTTMYMESVLEKYQTVKDILAFDEKIQKGYGAAIAEDIKKQDALMKALDKGYFEVSKEVYDYTVPSKIGTYKGDNKEDAEIVKAARNFYKDAFSEIKSYFSNDNESVKLFTEKSAKINRELYNFISYFHNKLMTEKKKRGIVSFADTEVFALKVLCENGEPTKIAQSYRDRYSEVYIDEYQDVNSIQDCIFKMVSRENARFLVGDIKQSIYGFRGADPSLFGSYRDNFGDYGAGEDAPGRRIFLSNNFRSAENIINFANAVSYGTFVDTKSKVGYYEGDKLVFTKQKADVDDDKPVTVAVVGQNDTKNGEAVYVCNEIEKLRSKGVNCGDITILLRTMSAASKFTEEMERRNIPYYCSTKKQFFDNPELALTLCWLNTIDNLRRDVYVCGVLKSPIYNFTLDELTLIRNKYQRDTLYNSVKAYTEENDFEKGRAFISDIEFLRTYSRGKTASELIWYLMYEKKLMCVVTKGKNADASRLAKNNLLLFYDYAKSFENGEFKGLNNFLSYIDELIAAKHIMPNAAAFAGTGNTVKIMTIHKSKGLEFPYCFICNTQSLCDKRDLRNKILFNDRLGIASNIPDDSGLGYYNSYIMDALRLAIEEDIIESDYLVLYVALTRGVSRMWVTCCDSKPYEFVQKYLNEKISKIYTITKYRYISWILPSLKYAPEGCFELEYVLDNEPIDSSFSEAENEDNIEIDVESLNRSIDFEYEFKALSKIPAKMAVSKLYPDMLDDDISYDMTAILKPKVPYFALNAKQNRGADIGNATHAFMQFCDFNRVLNNGVDDELSYLIEKAYLPKEAGELVDTDALNEFFASDLFKRIFYSKKVYREKRFNVNLPASEFTSETNEMFKKENVLAQGVIDCFFYEDDEIVLVDYKTDFIPLDMDKVKGRELLKQKHQTQLLYYQKALEKITGSRVKSKIIYSFSLGEWIEC